MVVVVVMVAVAAVAVNEYDTRLSLSTRKR
jgi:hypothetical protein